MEPSNHQFKNEIYKLVGVKYMLPDNSTSYIHQSSILKDIHIGDL